MPIESITYKTSNTLSQEPDHTYNKKTLSSPDCLILSGTFGDIPRIYSIPTHKVMEKQTDRGNATLLEKSDSQLICREILQIKITKSMKTTIKNEIFIQSILNKAISSTEEVMDKITISSSGLMDTPFNIDSKRLEVYKKTSLPEADKLFQKVQGKGKIVMDEKTQRCIDIAQDNKKKALINAWQKAISPHIKNGWKELSTILDNANRYKMGNCDVQAHLAVKTFNQSPTLSNNHHFKGRSQDLQQFIGCKSHIDMIYRPCEIVADGSMQIL